MTEPARDRKGLDEASRWYWLSAMVQTFLGSKDLPTSIRGLKSDEEHALGLHEPANRVFPGSAFVDLEMRPKAAFHKQTLESGLWEHPEAPQPGASERPWCCRTGCILPQHTCWEPPVRSKVRSGKP